MQKFKVKHSNAENFIVYQNKSSRTDIQTDRDILLHDN